MVDGYRSRYLVNVVVFADSSKGSSIQTRWLLEVVSACGVLESLNGAWRLGAGIKGQRGPHLTPGGHCS